MAKERVHLVEARIASVKERPIEACVREHVGKTAHGDGPEVPGEAQAVRHHPHATHVGRETLRGARPRLPHPTYGEDRALSFLRRFVERVHERCEGAWSRGGDRVDVVASEALQHHLPDVDREGALRVQLGRQAIEQLHRRTGRARSAPSSRAGRFPVTDRSPRRGSRRVRRRCADH